MRPNSAAAKKQAKTETTAAEKNKNQCRRWRLASCVPCTTAVRTESDAPTTVLADRASQLLTETRQHPPRNHQQQRRQTAQEVLDGYRRERRRVVRQQKAFQKAKQKSVRQCFLSDL